MPSRSCDPGWDFSCVLDLIDSDSQDVGSTPLSPRTSTTIPLLENNAKSEKMGGKRLGSFSKLWEQLGVPDDLPLPAISPFETDSEYQTDFDNTHHPSGEVVEVSSGLEQSILPRTVPLLSSTDVLRSGDIVNDVDTNIQSDKKTSTTLLIQHVTIDGVTDSDNVDGKNRVEDMFAGMSKKQRSKARKRAEEQRRATAKLAHQLQDCERKQEMEEEALQRRLDSSVENAPKRNHAGVLTAKQQRAESRPNAGAKRRPPTSPLLSLTLEHGKAPTLLESNMIPSEPAPCSTLSPGPLAVLSSVHTPLPEVSLHVPKSTPNQTKPTMQYTTVGTPARQTQFPFPQSTPLVMGLVPRNVQPVVVPRMSRGPVSPRPAPTLTTPQITQPPTTPGKQARFLNIRPRVERHFEFLHQLLREFPEDLPWLLSPMQLCNEKTSTKGIHVFVDSSNIMIGFKDALRNYRAQGFEMSFDSLVLLMERRRPVAKRVYAGSHRESAPLAHVTKLVETSKAIGYENIVNEQVLISRKESEKKKFFRAVKQVGWNRAAQLYSGNSGSGSDAEMETTPATPSAPKWVEQGVDEILHLKMCQSIIDTEVPTTMVLATGDGAEAEHSDGFLAHVERALKTGWKVELVCWKQQTNGGYKNKPFRDKWGEQFKILYLDGYMESLIDTV